MNIKETLFSMQDIGYKAFQEGLMPTVPKESVIGVRTPALRKLAKEIANTEEALAFLNDLPHTYYEENNLHSYLLSSFRDFDAVISELDRFLPFVNNWATCDSISPKVFRKHKTDLLPHIMRWMASDAPYTVRFAIEMLMSFYLDEDFSEQHLKAVADIHSEEYYVNMMIAWYFATALAKKYDQTLPFLTDRKLPSKWVHNKTIQKAVESNRISASAKEYLKTLRLPTR